MEIIKEGDGNRAKCGECSTVVKFAASDIMRRTVSMRDPDYYEDGPESRYSVKCPSCRAPIEVSGKITPRIAKIVAERQRYEDHDL